MAMTTKRHKPRSMEAFIQAGETPISEKNYIDELKREKIVQVNIKMSEKMRTDIKSYCVRHHVSMNTLLQELVTEEMKKRLEMEKL